ncbi:MAG: OB-fold domain-containing protein [Deltaproteobacteria bacterium]|nr:OB-fold domain-containing protein [Deltaproteobacteria bacterium]
MSDAPAWLPAADDTNRPFFDGARAGKLRLQRCDACGGWMFPVRQRCQHCGSTRLAWADASGRGVLYSHGQLQREYHARHRGRLPVILAQVDLEEGVRMNTNLVGITPEQVRAGMRVRVAFETSPAGEAIPVFEPA